MSNQVQRDEVKSAVQKHYSEAIARSSCCGESSCCSSGKDLKQIGYAADELTPLPSDAVENSFGCGNPLAMAGLRPGDVVLDIGSGAGIDCLIAARKVGPTGKVIGLDMTPEMIDRARENARKAGAGNVEFRLGDAENMPVPDASVDVVISNCVINLSADKPAVFKEIARVLKPGGRLSVSDIVAEELPAPVRESLQAWAICAAGAIPEAEYLRGLEAEGLRGARVTDRIVYDAEQLYAVTVTDEILKEIPEARAREMASQVAGKIWSARIEAYKPVPAEWSRQLEIGPATSNDTAAVEALLRESELPSLAEASADVEVLVARRGPSVIGCVGLEAHGEFALLRSFAVSPAWRGVGAGKKLGEALLARARERGLRKAYMLTTSIVPLAERWGFRRVERSTVPEPVRSSGEFQSNGCASAVAMERDLTK